MAVSAKILARVTVQCVAMLRAEAYGKLILRNVFSTSALQSKLVRLVSVRYW